MAVIGDNGAYQLRKSSTPSAARLNALETGLNRATAEGISPIVLVRAAQRHFQRLHVAVAACGQGKTPHEAIKSLKPPVLFMFLERFQHQPAIWTEPRLATALQILTEAEGQCKSTGAPSQAIGERALMRLLCRTLNRGTSWCLSHCCINRNIGGFNGLNLNYHHRIYLQSGRRRFCPKSYYRQD